MKSLGYRLPFVVMFVLGLFFVVQYYVPHPYVAGPSKMMQQWKQPLNAFIIFVAVLGLVSVHIRKVLRREKRYGYSVITLVAFFVMTAFGLFQGIEDGSVFATWFLYLITPIEATMFALLAFYIASAAFRAFRARSMGATVLLISGVIVMLGFVPAVESGFPIVSKAADFILKYPNTAAKRAILMGVALGAISVSLRTIVGMDKTILGKGR